MPALPLCWGSAECRSQSREQGRRQHVECETQTGRQVEQGHGWCKTNHPLPNRYQVSLNSLTYVQMTDLLLRTVTGSPVSAPAVLCPANHLVLLRVRGGLVLAEVRDAVVACGC